MPDQGKLLLKYFKDLWEEKYKRPLEINLFKEKWAAVDVIDSVGAKRAKELIDYYFTTGNLGHSLQWFFYNFDKLDSALKEKVKDKEHRAKIMQQTKERVVNEPH